MEKNIFWSAGSGISAIKQHILFIAMKPTESPDSKFCCYV